MAEVLRREPFTLVLSAGFFGFFAHAGLLRALEELELRPARVVGVSAGALAGGLWCAGLDAQTLGHQLLEIRRHDFWDPGLPLGGLLRGRKFEERLSSMLRELGVKDIESCALPFTAVVHRLRGKRLLALEAGDLVRSIRASCSVPFLFRPVRVHGRWCVDGGVSDRSGLSTVQEDERVLYHHLPTRSVSRGSAEQHAAWVRSGPSKHVLVGPAAPRPGPFHLEAGPEVLSAAHRQALDGLTAAT